MKFYNYLNESRAKRLTKDEIIRLLKTDYRQAFNGWMEGYHIYRGVNWGYTGSFNYINPGKGRVSANTLNYYTLIVNNHPSWKEYPRRELICTTDINAADDYGVIFNIFPINNAKIGICSRDDFWFSFPYGIKQIRSMSKSKSKSKAIDNMDHFNKWLNEFLSGSVTDWRDLELQLKNIQFEDSNKSLYDIIIPALNPEKNDFEVSSIGNFSAPYHREVWLDQECLLIYNGWLQGHKKELIDEVL